MEFLEALKEMKKGNEVYVETEFGKTRYKLIGKSLYFYNGLDWEQCAFSQINMYLYFDYKTDRKSVLEKAKDFITRIIK